MFMGTLSYCVEASVDGVGGADNLDAGDIILYNWPYGAGSHAQDAVLTTPVFTADADLIGFAASKAHWLDIGAQSPYNTNTTDVFQEGTFFPGVKLCAKGELVADIYRTVIANSRIPDMPVGDLNAQMTGVRVGARALSELVERFGIEAFRPCVERMVDHGETLARQVFARIPDGRYIGRGEMDGHGGPNDDATIPFEIGVEVEGSTIRVDFSNVPHAQPGPINTPVAATISTARLAMSLLAGGGDAPHEGICRPVEVVTRSGSMFHPHSPSPCFVCSLPAFQAVDVIYQALFQAIPEGVPACCGGDVSALVWWGAHPVTGEPWGDGPPHPSGQGAHAHGDGANAVQHALAGNMRNMPAEVYETKTSLVVLKEELAPDSCGPGTFRGGLGIDKVYESLDDSTCVSTLVERTRNSPWGLNGGGPGRSTRCILHLPDGTSQEIGKSTALQVPTGAVLSLHTGGGGGFGDVSERSSEAVRADLRDGYITDAHAERQYAHAFASAKGGEGTGPQDSVQTK